MLFGIIAVAQQNPPDAPPPATFQSSVQLIQVRVIAEDEQGKPITDLRQEEFQLVDNGVSQDIRLFLNESERLNITPSRSHPAYLPIEANPVPVGTADIWMSPR